MSIYSKKSQVEHVLLRPDTYVGSAESTTSIEYVCDKDTFEIYEKNIKYNPALLRIFIEPLSNAVDNVYRSNKEKIPCKYIRVKVDKETGKTTIKNDGKIVEIEMHPEEKCWNHSLIFGQLLTSSNYNDDEKREYSGRNGLGVKCTNIFSTMFEVIGTDPEKGLKFKQVWKENMTTILKPKVTKIKSKLAYTTISWTPDFKRFGLEGYTDDIIDMYRKFCVDASMLTGVKFYFNDTLLPSKNILKYAKLYRNVGEKLYSVKKGKHSFCFTKSPTGEFVQISFVNGVFYKKRRKTYRLFKHCTL